MARPEEKSQSMLHRYLRERTGEDGAAPGRPRRHARRPYLATLCEDVDEAEKWRRQVLGDISRKVSEIQNAGLGAPRLRELNDEINKLLREKRHWDRRVRDLGGRNHARDAEKFTDSAASHKGYFYFGAARNLPGVPALLSAGDGGADSDGSGERDDTPIGELLSRVDAGAYYGGAGDEDGEALVRAEAAREARGRAELAAAWIAAGRAADAGPPAWDPAVWAPVVGRAPAAGDELPGALREMELRERKRAAARAADALGR